MVEPNSRLRPCTGLLLAWVAILTIGAPARAESAQGVLGVRARVMSCAVAMASANSADPRIACNAGLSWTVSSESMPAPVPRREPGGSEAETSSSDRSGGSQVRYVTIRF